MLYLIRYAEPGREPQPDRSLIERDLMEVIGHRLPGARIAGSDTGRLFVEVEAEAAPVLASIHGLTSFSPCRRAPLDSLEEAAVGVAREAVAAGARTYAVRCKRVGSHGERSVEIAARVGAAVGRALPSLKVDLASPDLPLGIEVRDGDAYVYREVVPGIDQGGSPERRAQARRGPTRFLADQMLGTLATWLRMLGYDTVYVREKADSFLLRQANAERRTLLTRDRPLARDGAADVVYLESRELSAQLREVLAALGLRVRPAQLFTRCSVCNEPLEGVDKEAVRDRVPPSAFARYHEFTRCPRCDKVYWRGGHYERMLETIAGFIDDDDAG